MKNFEAVKEQVLYFLRTEADPNDIITLNNDELSNDDIIARDDFDDYFKYDSILDIIDRIDSSFDTSALYFKSDSYSIESSDDLEDFIDYEEIADLLIEKLDTADDDSDLPDGFENLFDLCKPLMGPDHTEQEIMQKTHDVVDRMSDGDLYRLSEMVDIMHPYYKMEDFVTIMKSRTCMDTPHIITALVRTLPGFMFDFHAPFFQITDDDLYSYSRTEVKREMAEHVASADRDMIRTEFPELADVLDGKWEDDPNVEPDPASEEALLIAEDMDDFEQEGE